MRIILAALAVLAAGSGVAHAQSTERCLQFEVAVKQGVDDASRAYAERNLPSRNAVQAAQWDAILASKLSLLQINLDLMAAAKCPLPAEPVSLQGYMPAMMRCVATTSTETCDRAKWTSQP